VVWGGNEQLNVWLAKLSNVTGAVSISPVCRVNWQFQSPGDPPESGMEEVVRYTGDDNWDESCVGAKDVREGHPV